jgi:hypothetical protein
MRKKNIGEWLVIIGILMFIGSISLTIIFTVLSISLKQYWLIISLLALMALFSFVIGGFMRKKDKSYRLLIIGVTMMVGGTFLNSLFFLIGEIFWVIAPPITVILIILGISFVISGALMENEEGKTP